MGRGHDAEVFQRPLADLQTGNEHGWPGARKGEKSVQRVFFKTLERKPGNDGNDVEKAKSLRMISEVIRLACELQIVAPARPASYPPAIAASATLALNTAECVRLTLFVIFYFISKLSRFSTYTFVQISGGQLFVLFKVAEGS
nr:MULTISPECIES: hypothetical protein [Nitrosospira]